MRRANEQVLSGGGSKTFLFWFIRVIPDHQIWTPICARYAPDAFDDKLENKTSWGASGSYFIFILLVLELKIVRFSGNIVFALVFSWNAWEPGRCLKPQKNLFLREHGNNLATFAFCNQSETVFYLVWTSNYHSYSWRHGTKLWHREFLRPCEKTVDNVHSDLNTFSSSYARNEEMRILIHSLEQL